jgi:sorbitol/mannitol transport system substrate-binding protein
MNAPAIRRFSVVSTTLLLLVLVSGWTFGGAAASSASVRPAKCASSGSLHLACRPGASITVATVGNPDMVRQEALTHVFTSETGIKVNYATYNEDTERAAVIKDVATHAGKFDVITIGPYDAPIYGKNKWAVPFQPLFNKESAATRAGYNMNDVLPSIRAALSYKGNLYAVPLYGESSMLYYRKDIFKAHGIHIALHPTWSQVANAAKKVNSGSLHGICLRGVFGWGEVLAPLDTVINTYGGEWYNMKWQAQLTSKPDEAAVKFYVNLVRKYGEPGAENDGFTECETAMATGKVAMWVDATVAAGFLEDPTQSLEAGKIGFAYSPTQVTPRGSHWLWSWAMGVESASKNKSAAAEFITWATSKQYIALEGKTNGWVTIPPGTRTSTYSNPNYKKAAGSFAGIVKSSILSADQHHATLHKVPYVGIQFVGIPEFEALGNSVSSLIGSAIAGNTSVSAALKQANKLANQAAKSGGYQK